MNHSPRHPPPTTFLAHIIRSKPPDPRSRTARILRSGFLPSAVLARADTRANARADVRSEQHTLAVSHPDR